MNLPQKFWPPSLTSQFKICPIPYHLDTYIGCTYGCRYCFARDIINFNRKTKPFNYLEANRPDLLRNWVEKTLHKPLDYNKGHEVALTEHLPIKIGANADPFPPIEAKAGITYQILEMFDDYRYPLEIQTKNPAILAKYASDFTCDIIPNWVIAVTLITTDENFAKTCEPYAPAISNRLQAIKQLTTMGFPVMAKIQPAIYPKIIQDLPTLVPTIKAAGCFGFNIEGLKYRITMPKPEQEEFQQIGNALGYNMRRFYRAERTGTTDYELTLAHKLEYTTLARQLATEHGLRFYVADNDKPLIKYSDSCECCGTEKLRNYKIFGLCQRAQLSTQPQAEHAKQLENCKMNFTRSATDDCNTIKEASKFNKMLSLRGAF